MFSMISTIVVCGLLIWGIVNCQRRASGYRTLFLGIILLSLVELGINNRWMLHPSDAGVMTEALKMEEDIEQLRDPDSDATFTVSVLHTDFQNQNFLTESSQNRIAELATWRREMLFPKTHLLIDDLRLLGSFTSIWPKAFDQINDQIVGPDASVQNVENSAQLKPERPNVQGSVDLPKRLTSQWQGQTLNFSFERQPDLLSPQEFQLPILPMPGWRANFSSRDNDQQQSVPLLQAGSLHSQLKVPDEFANESFHVRCVYFPASFFRGALISIAGWLSLMMYSLMKLRP